MIVKTNITSFFGIPIVKTSLLPLFIFFLLLGPFSYGQSYEFDISKQEVKEEIRKELIREMNNLEWNLKFISNPTNEMKMVDIQIAMALKKFESKTSIVQVTSLQDTSKRDNVEVYAYLYHLSRLRKVYHDIHIEFRNKQIGEITRLSSGKNRFRATGIFMQIFVGLNDDDVSYADKTEKSIDFEVYPTIGSDGTVHTNILILRIDVRSTEELSPAELSSFQKN